MFAQRLLGSAPEFRPPHHFHSCAFFGVLIFYSADRNAQGMPSHTTRFRSKFFPNLFRPRPENFAWTHTLVTIPQVDPTMLNSLLHHARSNARSRSTDRGSACPMQQAHSRLPLRRPLLLPSFILQDTRRRNGGGSGGSGSTSKSSKGKEKKSGRGSSSSHRDRDGDRDGGSSKRKRRREADSSVDDESDDSGSGSGSGGRRKGSG